MTLREALIEAAQRLSPISDTPRLDAELLAAHALGVDRNTLLLKHLDDDAGPDAFAPLVERRLTCEPLAYITGSRDFWTLSLKVAPGVLIPRPDSETLIEAALDFFDRRKPDTVLDLGTGSGALLLAALSEFPEARGIGVDQSPVALTIAEENAERCQLTSRVAFNFGNWGDGIEGRFDLILCNPPYISTEAALPKTVAGFEPSSALFAGADGLTDYRALVPQIERLMSPEGCAIFEIGFDQAACVGSMFAERGFSVKVRKDLGGRDRCLVLTKSL